MMVERVAADATVNTAKLVYSSKGFGRVFIYTYIAARQTRREKVKAIGCV